MKKITELTPLTTPEDADLLLIVDSDEAVEADQTKSITLAELLDHAPKAHAASHYSDGSDPLLTVSPATSDTSIDSNTIEDNTIVICDSATQVTVTVNLEANSRGKTVEFLQLGAGSILLVADTGVTLCLPATFSPSTAAQFSSLVVTILTASGDSVLVRGHLTPL